MSSKNFGNPHRHKTSLSPELVAKMRNASDVENCLDAGSKNRLYQYRRELSVSRNINNPYFDDKVLKVIKKYAINKSDVEDQVNYLSNLTDEDGLRFSRNLKIYDRIDQTVKVWIEPSRASFAWNCHFQKVVKRMKERYRKLNLKTLSYSCDDDIRNALPKSNTHSGFFYIESGVKKKGENMEGIYEIYQEAEKNAILDGTFDRPVMIAFRTQASGEYDEDGNQTNECKHKLRVVSMIDLLVIIAELRFLKPLQNAAGRFKYYAGGKSRTEISSIINQYRYEYDRFFSLDFSHFDASLNDWQINYLFEVWREAFPNLSESDAQLFEVLKHDYKFKKFLFTEGLLEVSKIMTSGLMGTNLGDTDANYVMISSYFESKGVKHDMIIMGDDNLVFFNDQSITLDDLSSYIEKNYGFIVNIDKSSQGYTNKDEISFLSTVWRRDGAWRHPHQLLSRLLYPERKRFYGDLITPEVVVEAYIQTYPLGMKDLIDVVKFRTQNPISKKVLLDEVDSRYIPGALAYIRDYTDVQSHVSFVA